MKTASSQLRSTGLAVLMLIAASGNLLAMELQGQDKGNTNTWSTVNLQGWLELDYIPFRVYFASGSAGTYTVNLDFPHLSGTTPGFEDLTSFTAYTSNVKFTSAPVLHTDPSGTWTYVFTVQVTNNNPGEVRFFARLAAGAHLNPGSSLHLSGNAGLVQIHKPGPGLGAPNLAIFKTGPASASAGSTIAYTLTYTNKSGTDVGVGSQLSDILPASLAIIPGSLSSNAHIVGNTIFWDLTNVLAHTGGKVTFQAQISPAVITGTVITNFSQILSSENDGDMSDNTSTWLTTVPSGCTPPMGSVTGNTNLCPASPLAITVNASGTSPFTYQWRHNGSNLPGATAASYIVAVTSATDAGLYDVLLGNMCGASTGSAAAVSFKTPVAATALTNVVSCPGSSVTFNTVASGTGPFSYLWRKDGSLVTNQTAPNFTIPSVIQANAGLYSIEISGACSTVTNSATLVVNQPVALLTPLTNQIGCPGNNITFAVGAIGTSLSYQWYKNSAILLGQTASTLSLNSVSNANAGTYAVVVSGACGTPITNSATLTVNQSVLITGAATNQTVCPGNNVTFAIGATGTSLNFQWYKDNALLSGETGTTLSLNSVSNANAGSYSVVVSGACGNALTNVAALTVNQNVIVTAALTNQTACPGNKVTFALGATGTSLSYQWYKNSSILLGQTANILSLNSVSNANAGTYAVVVSGACGNPITNSAVLTVNQNVLITAALTNQTVCPGNNVLFAIGATGTSLSYQWYKDNALLSGETGTTLSLNSVSNANAGNYSVVVGGACGNAVTNVASLTVIQNVIVTATLTNQTACPGNNVTFAVGASGTSLSYQWYKNSNIVVGQTASTLSLNSVSNVSAGTYSVIVSGACGNPITNSALLTVNQDVVITSAITNQTACPGNNVLFAIGATGTSLSFQWFKDNALLNTQTASTLSLNSVSNANAGNYSVVVSGACGNPITNSASLTVNQNVVVTGALTNQTVCPGNNVLLAISATGTSLNYQWYKGSAILGGQTGSTLSLNNVSNANAGTYSVVVSGACGNPITNSALLAVNQNVVITSALTNQTVCPGNNVTFAIGATGTSLSYQWYKDNAILSNQTGNTLSLGTVSNANAAVYSVVVSGTCGNALTNSAVLTVNENPLIAAGLTNQIVCPGNNVLFAISATGTSLNYQWYKGATILGGQTGSTFSLNNVSNANAGTYSVVVSGACGSPITNAALLTVNQDVVITGPLTNQTVCPRDNVAFIVDATGTSLSYQWYKDNAILPGQSGNSLSLNSVSNANAGAYSVVVSATCGNHVTNTALLTVNQNVIITGALTNQSACPGDDVLFAIRATGTSFSYQWYKESMLLPTQTGSTLSLNNVSNGKAGTYSVVVMGTCGNPVTNSAVLTVNQTISITGALTNQTACPGDNVLFAVGVTGPSLSYQWYKDNSLLNGQTTNTLSLSSVSNLNAGAYSVVISSACGNPVTNTAVLTVNVITTASALPNVVKNAGANVTFTTIASGSGTLTYVWKQNGTVIPGATTNSLTITNITSSNAGTYTVQVTGNCGSATATGSLTLNVPPTVNIISPTNGTVFIAPATFALAANAYDVDGTVTNVEFYTFVTNKLGETTNSTPGLIFLTNAPVGNYTYIAVATDNLGARGTSAPVSISVTIEPRLTIISAIHLDPQTGLFIETVRVFNPTPDGASAARVYISNLSANTTVHNASGATNGTPYVQSHDAVPAGGYVDLIIEYANPFRITPNPTLHAALVLPEQGGGAAVAGIAQPINRVLMLPDHTFLIEFLSLPNRLYYIEYSSDMITWKTAQPAVTGTGTYIQWIDNGQPKTESAPSTVAVRYYRLVMLP